MYDEWNECMLFVPYMHSILLLVNLSWKLVTNLLFFRVKIPSIARICVENFNFTSCRVEEMCVC
jgi:hypothetical protein